jgi:hypothetical protein
MPRVSSARRRQCAGSLSVGVGMKGQHTRTTGRSSQD